MSISLRTRFTEGDCHILARAIHEATGWPIATFSYDGGPDTHAFVQMPDGRYLDIEGTFTRKQMLDRWTIKPRVILHFDSVAALHAADEGWTESIEWPSSRKIAERVARKLLWHGH